LKEHPSAPSVQILDIIVKRRDVRGHFLAWRAPEFWLGGGGEIQMLFERGAHKAESFMLCVNEGSRRQSALEHLSHQANDVELLED
jgi:hypothetical protein